EGAVTAVAISADGRVATGSADKKVRVWPPTGEQPSQTLAGHRDTVTAVAWARDNRTLATGGNDRDVILWAADTGKQIRSIDHPSEVQCLAFSPDGTKLAVGSADDRLRVYQVATGKRLAELEKAGSPPNVSAVAWSSDSAFVLAGRGNHTLQYWSLKANKDVQNIQTMAPVNRAALSADGKTLVGMSHDRSVRFWDAATGRLKLTLIADTAQILAIGADGNFRCPDEAESELVAVVQTDKGHETLSLKEFAQRYGFRNNPAMAK
ncbi:MAG TPA: WD40 repeat domain-containing protein, partial [Gemmataceae bacterium]|nr:WD40 repeat domain-containing protein [Gemmataceae bacterium]